MAAVFDVDANHRGPLKGRLKHLNALTVPELRVGRGTRLLYSLEQSTMWLVALLVQETGADPVVAAEAVKRHWERSLSFTVRSAMDEKSRGGNHVYLTLTPTVMTGAWASERHPLETIATVGYFRDKQEIHGRQARNVALHLERATERRTWLSVRDLTADFEISLSRLDEEKS